MYRSNKAIFSEIYAYSLYIFNKKIRHSWILWTIFVNRNNFGQIKIFANRNNIHDIELLKIGIGIYSWPKYQQIDSWQIYLQTICKLFANYSLITGSSQAKPNEMLCHHAVSGRGGLYVRMAMEAAHFPCLLCWRMKKFNLGVWELL